MLVPHICVIRNLQCAWLSRLLRASSKFSLYHQASIVFCQPLMYYSLCTDVFLCFVFPAHVHWSEIDFTFNTALVKVCCTPCDATCDSLDISLFFSFLSIAKTQRTKYNTMQKCLFNIQASSTPVWNNYCVYLLHPKLVVIWPAVSKNMADNVKGICKDQFQGSTNLIGLVALVPLNILKYYCWARIKQDSFPLSVQVKHN